MLIAPSVLSENVCCLIMILEMILLYLKTNLQPYLSLKDKNSSSLKKKFEAYTIKLREILKYINRCHFIFTYQRSKVKGRF